MRKFFMFFFLYFFWIFSKHAQNLSRCKFIRTSWTFRTVDGFQNSTLTHPNLESISCGTHVSVTLWLILRAISRIVFMYLELFSLKSPEGPRSHYGRWVYKFKDGPPLKNILHNSAYLLQIRPKTYSGKSNPVQLLKTTHALALEIWPTFGKST